MKQYTFKEAVDVHDRDIWWMQDAGFLDKDGCLNMDLYVAFMSGTLKLPTHVEIEVNRRLERLVELEHWIEYLKSDKAKFRT